MDEKSSLYTPPSRYNSHFRAEIKASFVLVFTFLVPRCSSCRKRPHGHEEETVAGLAARDQSGGVF
jgi:hypothetical protein